MTTKTKRTKAGTRTRAPRPRTKLSSSRERMPSLVRTRSLREVFVLVGKAGEILWADASDSPAALPDSRARWEAIWSRRDDIDIIAHSHPIGPSAFSAEDESTMAALDDALGTPMRYAVVAPRVTIVRQGLRAPVDKLIPEPWWVALVRLASGMTKEE